MSEFITDTGIKINGITAEEMRRIDRIAVENNSPNLFQMMENAGRNLALLIIETAGKNWRDKRILVLAGKGGNGGGGICAARHLANRNMKINLYLLEENGLKGVPLIQYNLFRKTNRATIESLKINNKYDIIIDAMIGYNLNRQPSDKYLQAIEFTNASGSIVISLDIPTGINSTTGDDYGIFVNADLTLTLAYPKTGLKKNNCGNPFLGDIGIPASVYAEAEIKFVNPFDNRWIVPIQPLQ